MQVPNLREYLDKAVSLGAQVLQQPTPVMEGLAVAMFTGPDGMPIGLMADTV